MGLTKSVLKRPVTVVMVILCLIVFGLQSVLGAKLELMPTMEMPVLIVYSVYPGVDNSKTLASSSDNCLNNPMSNA